MNPVFALALSLAQSLPVQTARSPAESQVEPDRPPAFVETVVGATLGSAVGLGVGLLVAGPQRCDQDDVGCIVSRLAYAGVFTVAGTSAGAIVAGGRDGGEPSALGAIAGATLGAAAGLGLWKLLEEAGASGGGVAAFVFTIPQGLLSATGAWLLGG